MKELRETNNNLRLMNRAGMLTDEKVLSEARQLVAIFTKSIETARKGRDARPE